METNEKIHNKLDANDILSKKYQKDGKIFNFYKLKQFRMKEYLVYNLSLIIFILLVHSLQYTGLSIRLMSIIPIIFLLVLSIMKNKIKRVFFSLFKFLEDLEYYEQQKLGANEKLSRSNQVITVILIIGLIFMFIYPSLNLYSLNSIIASLIGLNIGKYLYNRNIDNM